jgi:hypothetical protein
VEAHSSNIKWVSLLKAQKQFLLSTSNKSLLLAGIGYGKSMAGAHFVINMVTRYPKASGLITANVYTQLINATIKTLTNELEDLNIPHKLVVGGANRHLEILGSKIYCYSLEKYNNIRGIEVGWWWGDESAFAKQEAIQVCRGRLRDKNGPLYERHTSSPNGYNWLYDEFENKDNKNITKKVALYRGITKENVFLPEGYYETLLDDYGGEDNPLAKQELFGQFTNLQSGAIYWGFDREKNVRPCKLDKRFPVHVGQDFNFSNMEGCYVQYIEGKFYVTKENILTHYGANTDSAAAQICKDLFPDYRVLIVPDSTGKANKTSARGMTDFEILKLYGLEIMPTRNSIIRDRQNSLNIHLKNCDVIIDPSCIKLIKELETLNARDKEGEEAHVSVSLGYVIMALKPIIRHRESRSIIL